MLKLHLQTLDIIRMYGIRIFHRLFIALFFLFWNPFLGILLNELLDPSR